MRDYCNNYNHKKSNHRGKFNFRRGCLGFISRYHPRKMHDSCLGHINQIELFDLYTSNDLREVDFLIENLSYPAKINLVSYVGLVSKGLRKYRHQRWSLEEKVVSSCLTSLIVVISRIRSDKSLTVRPRIWSWVTVSFSEDNNRYMKYLIKIISPLNQAYKSISRLFTQNSGLACYMNSGSIWWLSSVQKFKIIHSLVDPQTKTQLLVGQNWPCWL